MPRAPTPGDAPGDWVLFRAESDLGPWMRRSAAAHTLILGCGFALLLLVLSAQAVRASFPGEARSVGALVLLGAALATAMPLPILAWVHGRRRIDAVSVDPQGLTLEGPRRVVRVPLARLASARAAAEPAFLRSRPVHRGDLRDIPGFHAVLDLRLDGARYEFVSRRSDDVAGILAWIDVLGAGDRIARGPSSLAAQHEARDALRRATLAMVGAVALAAASATAQLGPRLGLAVPQPMLVTLLAVLGGSALYLLSYHHQLRAAQAWLDARGLLGGPPVPPEAPGNPAAGPAPAPPRGALAPERP